MSPEDLQILERYRTLHKQAEVHQAKVADLKARVRTQWHKIAELDSAAKKAKIKYQDALMQQMSNGFNEDGLDEVREQVARLEADLTHAKGIMGAYEAELPKLQSSFPNSSEEEGARRDAWDAIARHLRTLVPKEVNELAVKIFAATLNNHPDAYFSVALVAMFPKVPHRLKCGEMIEQLAREYDIPSH